MQRLTDDGRFELQRRCVAVVDGCEYYGEVFDGQQRIFVDPAHPSLQPPSQWVYIQSAQPSTYNSGTTVMFF